MHLNLYIMVIRISNGYSMHVYVPIHISIINSKIALAVFLLSASSGFLEDFVEDAGMLQLRRHRQHMLERGDRHLASTCESREHHEDQFSTG